MSVALTPLAPGAMTWVPLTLLNGWSWSSALQQAGWPEPSVMRDAYGRVWMRGAVSNTVFNANIATIPVGFRPTSATGNDANRYVLRPAIVSTTQFSGYLLPYFDGNLSAAGGGTGALTQYLDCCWLLVQP